MSMHINYIRQHKLTHVITSTLHFLKYHHCLPPLPFKNPTTFYSNLLILYYFQFLKFNYVYDYFDTLCGLVARVIGHRSRGPEFDSRHHKTFREVVGLEQGPLSLMSITEELLEWKSRSFGSRKSRLTAVGIRCADHPKVSNNFP
jgi:hypothetical protein